MDVRLDMCSVNLRYKAVGGFLRGMSVFGALLYDWRIFFVRPKMNMLCAFDVETSVVSIQTLRVAPNNIEVQNGLIGFWILKCFYMMGTFLHFSRFCCFAPFR